MSLVERKLQLTINRVSHWAVECGFPFSPSKTVAMHFYRLYCVHPDPDLYLSNSRISCAETTRYLGVDFDIRLTWVAHLRSVKKACQKAYRFFRFWLIILGVPTGTHLSSSTGGVEIWL